VSREAVASISTQASNESADGLLQRKCDCGNKASAISGDCEECQISNALGLQTKLAIGASDDPLEHEADLAAAHVMGISEPSPGGLSKVSTPVIHRRPLQSAKSAGKSAPRAVNETLKTPGERLSAKARSFFEPRFGYDFSQVRIHDDPQGATSARAVGAHAYTVGNHVVFNSGRYTPDSAAGKVLLAHELTHVIQQRQPGGANLSTTQREGEARQVSSAITHGGPMPRISAACPTISRDPEPGSEDDASFEATMAEATCDIGALCRLSQRAPTVVTHERLMRAYSQCHPGVSPVSLVAGNPCLTPNFGLPALPTAPGPRRAQGPLAAPGSSPGAASSGGLSLPSTTIRFKLGAAAFKVDLPASLAIRLPVPFRGAERVVFSLNASPDEFSFRATINATQHVRIIANAGITTEGVGSAGLTVQTTRTTCQAVSPAAARSALQSAGTRLRDAIQAVPTPPAADPDASQLARDFAPHARYTEVVAAVAHLNSEIERIQAPCREVPVASFNFGAQGQVIAPDDPEDRGAPTFIGASLRLHF
jgi:hypothetical protein